MKPDQIKRIAEVAKGYGERILDRWLPGGKRQGKEYTVRNPHRDDKHVGNLSIEVASGRGGDFATGETFGDFVGMVAFAMQCKPGEAAEALAQFLGIPAGSNAVPPAPTLPAASSKKPPQAWRVIVPVPETAPPLPKAHPKRGRPSMAHAYRDGEGRLLGYVCRHDARPPEFPRKDFYPWTWCENGAGKGEWRCQSWPLPRPLYGLDLLAKQPHIAVMVHEGEKSAEAGRRLLPGFVHVTWPNGANAADKVDCSPLKDRDLWLWRDHDKPGREAMRIFAKQAMKAGARSVQFVNVEGLFAKHASNGDGRIVERLAPLPAGWDCADCEVEGFTRENLEHLLSGGNATLDKLPGEPGNEPEADESNAEAAGERAGPYLLDDALGLFYLETDRDGRVRQVRLCGPLRVVALARDGDGGSWSVVIEYLDRDGQRRREVIAFRQFLCDGYDGIKQLADLGLEIASGRQSLDRIKSYIVGAHTDKRAKLVDQTGWHGNAFLFPDGAIGETDETLLFRGNRRAHGTYATRGKLTEWQINVAAHAGGNPRLMFCISVAFCGPLLKVLGAASAIFHWVGDSSIGKSGALAAAGSVWGPKERQVHSWRHTANALELTAALHSDILLLLDEIKEIGAKELALAIYMIINQKPKGRMGHDGSMRYGNEWRSFGLSAGEAGVADLLAGIGEKHHAGQMVRFIEIDANANCGHGMWNTVSPLDPDAGKNFTNQIKENAGRYYGTAGRAFVAELCKRVESIPPLWRQHDLAFAEDYRPANAGGQVLRVLASFSLVAFAGELAAEWGIVPWQHGEASAAAGALFEEWLKERPTKGNSEEAQIITHVRGLLERTWQSRFIDWERATGRRRTLEKQDAGDFSPDLSRMALVHDALGFRREEIPFDADRPSYLFYVTRQRFADEFAAKGGFKPKRVAALLKARGVLNCDPDSTTLRETLPSGDPRSYCIVGSKLWALES